MEDQYPKYSKLFDEGQKIFYRRREEDDWKVVTDKTQLYCIHQFMYKAEPSQLFEDLKADIINMVLVDDKPLLNKKLNELHSVGQNDYKEDLLKKIQKEADKYEEFEDYDSFNEALRIVLNIIKKK